MPKIGASTSVIGIVISCGTKPGSEGLDGSKEVHIWVSFRFPDMPPVQIEIPMYMSDHPSKEEGESGDNTGEAASRITQGLSKEVESGNITDEQADGITVEEREDPAGGTDKDYYCRIVLDGVVSIDGGSDYGKIRVSGHVGGAKVATGVPIPTTGWGKIRRGWEPGLARLPWPPRGRLKCPKGKLRGMDQEDQGHEKRFKEDSPSSEEQEEEWEDWGADPNRKPGDVRAYPDGQWRNRTGGIK